MSSGQESSGVKLAAVSKDYHTESLRARCRELGVSINDLYLAAVSVGLKQYLLDHDDTRTTEVLVMVPSNMRMSSENLVSNTVGSYPLRMPLFTDFKQALAYFN